MRFVAALLFWLLTTAALAVAVPAMWAQHNVVDEDGYAALARRRPPSDPLQDAMAVRADQPAGLLARQQRLRRQPRSGARCGDGLHAQSGLPRPVRDRPTGSCTAGCSPTPRGSPTTSGRWEIDLSPMLADSSFQQTLQDFGISAPSTLEVPLTDNAPDSLRPGSAAPAGHVGAVGQRRRRDRHGRLRAADARRRPSTRQSACRAGCFGAARGCGRVGRHRGGSRQRRRCAGRHHRRHPQIADAMVGHADRQPAPVAEPDAGRRRRAGGLRRHRLDAGRSAPSE